MAILQLSPFERSPLLIQRPPKRSQGVSMTMLWSCAIVITEPNLFVAEVHDRMPVVLEAKDFEQWERGDVKDAAALMTPASEDVLQKWPVSRRVNSSRTSDEDATSIEVKLG